jgi:hypothetical protein
MKNHRISAAHLHLHLQLAALAIAASSLLLPAAAMAQASAPAPLAAASANTSAATAAPPIKLGPRLLTPAETRDNASAAGDVRPERPVTPQVSIPFGKAPPPAQPGHVRVARPGNVASSGGVDDAAARCEAQSGEQVRVKCRDKIAREARVRPPG